MSRISFRDNEEEHNFWQNYTDLISGFLIVFIITSLIAYSSYKVYVDLYNNKGITEKNINDIVVKAELFNKIKEFQEAQEKSHNKYFEYKKEYNRFECNINVQFKPKSSIIPQENYSELIEAGKEIEKIIIGFQESTNVSFKVVIEGRAAKSLRNKENNTKKEIQDFAACLSYERARNLYLLWKSNGLFNNIEHQNGEIFISGSGFEGIGRHTKPIDEEKNKTFIIQIIPYINYK